MALLLHCGAREVPFDELHAVETPPATATHVPIEHHRVVELVRYALGFYGHEIVEEHHAVTEDNMRYFGLMSLRSRYGDYTDTVGLRNSHDKKFPIGIAFGSRVFVCDNCAFHSEHLIRRKHTVNAWRDLPGLLAGIIEPLAYQRQAQQQTIERYKTTALSVAASDHAVLELYRRNVININRVPEVLHEYDEPSFQEMRDTDRNAWRLFNAVTFILTGRALANPRGTKALHQVIDGVCEHVA